MTAIRSQERDWCLVAVGCQMQYKGMRSIECRDAGWHFTAVRRLISSYGGKAILIPTL